MANKTWPCKRMTGRGSIQVQRYDVYSFDVLGNARDGFEVNDRCCYARGVEIRVRGRIFNAGTPQEFTSFVPSANQLSRAANARGCVWDGEPDYGYHAEARHNGRPMGELERVKD